ncbi:MAG: hypothetical protein GF398_11730 [Chitinivibrionales bacterium]|nr:hypothetical protein [Chitinivibrionales bacterium]
MRRPQKVLPLLIVIGILTGCTDKTTGPVDVQSGAQATFVAPVLVRPFNNATEVDTVVNFVWNSTNIIGAVFDVYLDTNVPISDSAFFIRKDLADTVIANVNIEYNKKYYWKVVAHNGVDTVESTESRFTTKFLGMQTLTTLNIAAVELISAGIFAFAPMNFGEIMIGEQLLNSGDNNSKDIVLDTSRNVWLLTENAGMVRFQAVDYSNKQQVAASEILYSISPDAYGHVWATNGSSVRRYGDENLEGIDYSGNLAKEDTAWLVYVDPFKNAEDSLNGIWIAIRGKNDGIAGYLNSSEVLDTSEIKDTVWSSDTADTVPLLDPSESLYRIISKIAIDDWVVTISGIDTLFDTSVTLHAHFYDFSAGKWNSSAPSVTVKGDSLFHIEKITADTIPYYDTASSSYKSRIEFDTAMTLLYQINGDTLLRADPRYDSLFSVDSLIDTVRYAMVALDNPPAGWAALYYHRQATIDSATERGIDSFTISIDTLEDTSFAVQSLAGDTVVGITRIDTVVRVVFDASVSAVIRIDSLLVPRYAPVSLIADTLYSSYSVIDTTRIDTTYDTVYTFSTAADGLTDKYVTAFIADSTGLYAGTWSSGLFKYDYSGRAWTAMAAINSQLPNRHITCMAFDWAGNLWCGTQGGGVYRIDGPDSYTLFTSTQTSLPSNYINDIAFDATNNTIAVATTGGLIAFLIR